MASLTMHHVIQANQLSFCNHPCIHSLSITTYLVHSCRGLEPVPAWGGREAMYTAWTRCRSVTGLTHIKRHISVHAYGLFRVSRTPNLHFFGLFEETIAPGGNTDTRKTYILNRERLQVFLNVKRQNQLSHCTTLKPYAAKHHARSAKRI